VSETRILASPRTATLVHHHTDPLYESPLCPYCQQPLDVVGVDTIICGGGIEPTATGLSCPCGYGFSFHAPTAPREARR
jgi:hypothetical protein